MSVPQAPAKANQKRRIGALALVLLGCVVGVAVGMGVYTFDYAEGMSYMSNDPTACVNCHIMQEQYNGWQHGSHHAAATCNDCHVPVDLLGKYATKIEHGYRHSKAFTLDDFAEPIRITPSSLTVVHNNCIRCHGEYVSQIISHSAKDADAVYCVQCHSTVGHGRKSGQ
ncbi:MAG: cytochrome c nitrite reductase small subunit [Phycisphaerales bacterium]|nr:cytochrome c nitrite reductase small subunit [Phycisphaerales bacterium]